MTNAEMYKTVDERYDEFNKFCKARVCEHCQCRAKVHGAVQKCLLEWLDLEYKEEPKPCPFCGGKAKVVSGIHEDGEYHWVECTECYGRSIVTRLADNAISAWNRRLS